MRVLSLGVLYGSLLFGDSISVTQNTGSTWNCVGVTCQAPALTTWFADFDSNLGALYSIDYVITDRQTIAWNDSNGFDAPRTAHVLSTFVAKNIDMRSIDNSWVDPPGKTMHTPGGTSTANFLLAGELSPQALTNKFCMGGQCFTGFSFQSNAVASIEGIADPSLWINLFTLTDNISMSLTYNYGYPGDEDPVVNPEPKLILLPLVLVLYGVGRRYYHVGRI